MADDDGTARSGKATGTTSGRRRRPGDAAEQGRQPKGADGGAAGADDDALVDYRRKRDLDRTPEPRGGRPPKAGRRAAESAGGTGTDAGTDTDTEGGTEPGSDSGRGGRFVVHQHDATRLHWDLRLEADGVLWSWAIPRGIPWDPKRNNLAVHTEDHPVEYLTFEGHIPEGTYGAGDMFIWDDGTYDLLSEKDGKVVVDLHGERAQGRYALFRTGAERDTSTSRSRRSRGRERAGAGSGWMIHRMDPPPDPERAWPPDPPPAPMRARPGEPVDGDDWAWEVRLSGLRVMVTLLPGAVSVHDAEGNDVSDRFPDVRRMGRATGSVEAVLDGVIEGEGGRLERRLQAAPSSVRRVAESNPVRFVACDLVWLEGHPRWDAPWSERRADLEAIGLDGPAWSTSPVHVGDGPVMFEAARQQGVTGLVGKRRDSPYRPGETTPDWIDARVAPEL